MSRRQHGILTGGRRCPAVVGLFTMLVAALPGEGAAQALEVELSIDKVSHVNKRYRVDGTTNLPTGTELVVQMRVGDVSSDQFMVTGLARVDENGLFECNCGSAALPKTGVHEVTVRVPINGHNSLAGMWGSRHPGRQPEEILAIVGRRGEKLTGPLVKRTAPQGVVALGWAVWIEASRQVNVTDHRGRSDREVAKSERRKYFETGVSVRTYLETMLQAHRNGWLSGPTGFNTPAYRFSFERIRAWDQLKARVGRIQGHDASAILLPLVPLLDELRRPSDSSDAQARLRELQTRIRQGLADLEALRNQLKSEP